MARAPSDHRVVGSGLSRIDPREQDPVGVESVTFEYLDQLKQVGDGVRRPRLGRRRDQQQVRRGSTAFWVRTPSDGGVSMTIQS